MKKEYFRQELTISLNIISLSGGLLCCMDCGFALCHQTERHKRKNGNIAIYEFDMIKSISERMQNQNSQETAVIKKSIKTLNKRLAELEKLIQSIYEDKIKGKIPETVCT